MPSVLQATLCVIVALAFWGGIGFLLGRRLLPAALVVPLAPILGWAVHNALALPLYRLAGFTAWMVLLGSVAFLAASYLFFRIVPPIKERQSAIHIPFWVYGLATLLAVVPVLALFPKISDETVTLAGPIFDHAKVAIIDEMVRLGVPPGNPFFGGQDAPLVYYYLWHFSAAQIALVFNVSAWEADVVLSAFTAFSSLTLMMGFAAWLGGRITAAIWVVPLAFAASLHNVLSTVLGDRIFYSIFLPPSGFAGWLFQTAWAPQHIASCSCVLLSSFLIVRLARHPSIVALPVLALVSAAGYESSTWVGGVVFGAAAMILAVILLAEIPAQARMRFTLALAAAGFLAMALAYPFLRDQFVNAAARSTGSPIIFYPYEVFSFWIPDDWRRILDIPGYWLALLVIEFPAIYIAGIISLVGHLREKLVPGLQFSTTEAFAGLALTSMLIAGYFTITFVSNNDLGCGRYCRRCSC